MQIDVLRCQKIAAGCLCHFREEYINLTNDARPVNFGSGFFSFRTLKLREIRKKTVVPPRCILGLHKENACYCYYLLRTE